MGFSWNPCEFDKRKLKWKKTDTRGDFICLRGTHPTVTSFILPKMEVTMLLLLILDGTGKRMRNNAYGHTAHLNLRRPVPSQEACISSIQLHSVQPHGTSSTGFICSPGVYCQIVEVTFSVTVNQHSPIASQGELAQGEHLRLSFQRHHRVGGRFSESQVLTYKVKLLRSKWEQEWNLNL